MRRVIDCIQKSNRAAIQKPTWSKDPATNATVVRHCLTSLQFYLDVAKSLDSDKKSKTDATMRLAYNNISRTSESAVTSWDATKPNVETAANVLNELKELIKSLV